MSNPIISFGTVTAAANTIANYATDAAFVSFKGVAASAGDFYYNTTENVYRGYQGGAWHFLKAANAPSYATDAAFVTAKGSAAAAGDHYHNSTAGVLRYHNGTSWISLGRTAPNELSNYSITASVAASALTIALKTAAAADASASDVIQIGFRSSTLTSGAYTTRTVTGALSVVASSGSTLGQTSARAGFIYVYAIDNAGTVELALSGTQFDEGGVWTTVAEGGAGAADSLDVIYSTTARSAVPIRLIGRILITEATAGTWASAPTEVVTVPFKAGRQLAIGSSIGIASTTTSTSYGNLTNRVNVSFTAARTGQYKIFTTAPILNSVAGTYTTIKLVGTTGSPVAILTQEAITGNASATPASPHTIALLTAGTAYTFDVQMVVSANTGTFAANQLANGVALVAEEI